MITESLGKLVKVNTPREHKVRLHVDHIKNTSLEKTQKLTENQNEIKEKGQLL